MKALGEKLGALDRPLDRVAFWYLAAVLAATVAMSAQTLQWMLFSPSDVDRRSLWSLLRVISWTVGNQSTMLCALQIGAVLVVLALVGLALRRLWGVAVALLCSALLISLALFGRYLAIFQEPKQFVAKSIWVKAGTQLVLLMLATHGVAALASLRLLTRRPVVAAQRLAIALLALIAPVAPVFWLVPYAGKGAPDLHALCLTAIAAAALALLTAARPHRGLALAAQAALSFSLVTQAIVLAIRIGERARHSLYSSVAEAALMLTALTAPALLALLVLLTMLRRQPISHLPADTTDQESTP